jgi:threonine dehydratase
MTSIGSLTRAAIDDAAQQIEAFATRTPLLESATLNALLKGRILIKAEMLQRTGSFKFRGAYNRISRIPADERERGVVAFSSGNHAQAVAAAAKLCGLSAHIVMPATAPDIKADRTRGFGAEVILFAGDRVEMQAFAHNLARERNAILVPPFDDFRVMAGQGTVGAEVSAQCAALDVSPDAVLVPCSGGGLVAGVATALSDDFPSTSIYAVEPEGYDDTRRSLLAGERLINESGAASICDALLVPQPGELTFEINRRLLAGAFAVPDTETERAMAALFSHLRLVAEPGGAIALAACTSGAMDCRGRTVVIIASGGNVDPARFAHAIGTYDAR